VIGDLIGKLAERREQKQRTNAESYQALVVDLARGEATPDPAWVGELLEALGFEPERLEHDVAMAADVLEGLAVDAAGAIEAERENEGRVRALEAKLDALRKRIEAEVKAERDRWAATDLASREAREALDHACRGPLRGRSAMQRRVIAAVTALDEAASKLARAEGASELGPDALKVLGLDGAPSKGAIKALREERDAARAKLAALVQEARSLAHLDFARGEGTYRPEEPKKKAGPRVTGNVGGAPMGAMPL